MMCYKMRRFEKIAEEKKRRQKEQELSFTVKDQPEILAKTGGKKAERQTHSQRSTVIYGSYARNRTEKRFLT